MLVANIGKIVYQSLQQKVGPENERHLCVLLCDHLRHSSKIEMNKGTLRGKVSLYHNDQFSSFPSVFCVWIKLTEGP